ncbi:hypothetical protein AGMMS50229_21530 [Campylobacterota bacterium]|nr:hypothetical protein AGMMS50229_21530 [Campylobacterota bacterium]
MPFSNRHNYLIKLMVLTSTSDLDYWSSISPCPSLVLAAGRKTAFFTETTKTVRKYHPEARIIFLDSAVRQINVQVAVHQQINAYWTLLDSVNEFLEGLTETAHGSLTCSPHVRELLQIRQNRFVITQLYPKPYFFTLSDREKELFTYIGAGVSLEDYGLKMKLTKKTVRNLKYRLMVKLHVHCMEDVIRLANELGLGNYY